MTNTNNNDLFHEIFTSQTPDLEMANSDSEEEQPLAQFITTSIVDDARGASLTKKLNSAYKHIDYALTHHINSVNANKLKDLKPEDFTPDLVGKIGNYFARYAKKRMSPNGELISLATACGYMSAFKFYFSDTYR